MTCGSRLLSTADTFLSRKHKEYDGMDRKTVFLSTPAEVKAVVEISQSVRARLGCFSYNRFDFREVVAYLPLRDLDVVIGLKVQPDFR